MASAEVKLHNGVPTMHIDGEPYLYNRIWAFERLEGLFPEKMKRIEHPFVSYRIGSWTGPGQYDFAEADEANEETFRKYPDKFGNLTVSLSPPGWWIESHPDGLQDHGGVRETGVSVASQVWWQDAGDYAKAALAHLNESESASRIVHINLSAMHTGEWFYIGGPLRYLTDRSSPMLDAFRRSMTAKYATDAALREAWGDPEVTFETVQIPTRGEELETGVRSFRDPQEHRKVVDFVEFYQDIMADALLHFAEIAYNAFDEPKLVGAYFGNVLDWINNPFMSQHIGHNGLMKALKSPYIHFLVGCDSYHDRAVGSEAFYVNPFASLRENNVLYISENDMRTYLVKESREICGELHRTPSDTRAAMQRNFCHHLTAGKEFHWADLFGGVYDAEDIVDTIAELREIGQEWLNTDRTPNAEIAAVVDIDSIHWQSLNDTYIVDTFISPEQRCFDHLNRVGAPHDLLVMDDLIEHGLDHYKVFLFLNAFYMDDRTRAWIRENLCRDGKTLVWLYAPGLINRDLSTDNMSELTGVDLRMDDVSCENFVRLTDLEHPFTAGGHHFGIVYDGWVFSGFSNHFGVHKPMGPLFYVEDPDAIELGRYSYDSSKVSFAVKDLGDWRSVYVSTPFVPEDTVRKIARDSGVHIYNETNEIFYANRQYVALHVKEGGERTIRLPEPADVYDRFENEYLAKGVTEFTFTIPDRSTKLFRLF